MAGGGLQNSFTNCFVSLIRVHAFFFSLFNQLGIKQKQNQLKGCTLSGIILFYREKGFLRQSRMDNKK